MSKNISEPDLFFKEVFEKVPAYKEFVLKSGTSSNTAFNNLPLTTKKNYLLENKIQDLCWNGELGNCHLIGSSSGFSKSGSVFWPKRPEDEAGYIQSLEKMLSANYRIDTKHTLILCCMALGSWIGGMTISSALRMISTEGRLPVTIATPGLNLSEAVEIYSRFYSQFEQTLWITNPSSINVIYSLIKRKGIRIPEKSNYFPVVGEYYPENFRENISQKFGFGPGEPFIVWTGYGSADTGDLGVETKASIALRKFIHQDKGLSVKMFQTEDTPMILEQAPGPYLEIIDNQIVVTKNQLIPLVRYNTGDEGGLLLRKDLSAFPEIPAELIEQQNERLMYVFGRASDSIVFYGTNLNVKNIHNYFLSLSEKYGYAGLFQVQPKNVDGVAVYHFTVYVNELSNDGVQEEYKKFLLLFLKGQSREFSAKYENISQSLGRDLITVSIDDIASLEGNVKHKFILD